MWSSEQILQIWHIKAGRFDGFDDFGVSKSVSLVGPSRKLIFIDILVEFRHTLYFRIKKKQNKKITVIDFIGQLWLLSNSPIS